MEFEVNFVTNLYTHIENLACYHRFSAREYPLFFWQKNRHGWIQEIQDWAQKDRQTV